MTVFIKKFIIKAVLTARLGGFAMRIENLDYKDAVTFLADRCGMTVPQEEKRYSNLEKPKLSRERAFSMNKAAARIFYENLASPDGEAARKYLSECIFLHLFLHHII